MTRLYTVVVVVVLALAPALMVGQEGKAEPQVHDLCKSLNQALVKADYPHAQQDFCR